MYLHGDKVVLSYTVGDMDVLEMPDALPIGKGRAGTVVVRELSTSGRTESSAVKQGSDMREEHPKYFASM